MAICWFVIGGRFLGLFDKADGFGVYLQAVEDVGFLALVFAVVEVGLAVELVGGDVEVAVVGEAEGVGPEECGVVGDGLDEAVGGDLLDGVAVVVGGVDVAVGVLLEAVGGGFAGDEVYGGDDLGFGLGLVAEGGGADAVEFGAGEGAVEDSAAVVADGDAVGAELDGSGGLAGFGGVDGAAFGEDDEAGLGDGAGVVVEAAPGFAGGEVDDDDAVGAVAGGVGDVGDASDAVSVFGADGEVEADVVEVGVEARDVGREEDGLDDLVGGEVDGDELGAVGDGVAHERSAGVEDPEVVGGVDDDGLDGDEVRGVGGGVEGVLIVVDLLGGVGDGLAVNDFGDGEGDEVAPAGEVDEDAVFAGDGDAGGHGAREGGDDFELAEGLVGGDDLGLEGRGKWRGGQKKCGRKGDGDENWALHVGLMQRRPVLDRALWRCYDRR
jgi:hypothetical protein